MDDRFDSASGERALAAELYEAYRAHTGGVSLASGAPIPDWAGIRPEIQAAWCASARVCQPTRQLTKMRIEFTTPNGPGALFINGCDAGSVKELRIDIESAPNSMIADAFDSPYPGSLPPWVYPSRKSVVSLIFGPPPPPSPSRWQRLRAWWRARMRFALSLMGRKAD